MPLLSLWKSDPDTVEKLSIQQIVSNAGNGELKDSSVCSQELVSYLSGISSAHLANYIDQCLAQPLTKGGLILQDLVNELGRRLEYTVENGRYGGTPAHIGFDGLWKVATQPPIIVEVKTTDTYRLSLDTLMGYRTKLVAAGKCGPDASILIVVGRQDTGELEAQIRGSRHAWDIRLISAEALIRLVDIKEGAGQPEIDVKVRSLLRPAEYTRLDALVDIVFSATKDVEAYADAPDRIEPAASPGNPNSAVDKAAPDVTSADDLKAKRGLIIAAYSALIGLTLLTKSRALFWTADHRHRIVCSLSKRYDVPKGRPYWYAFHPGWRDFLAPADEKYLILGAMDLNQAFAIPVDRLDAVLPFLNTTYKPDGKTYWHLHILQDASGAFSLYVPTQAPLELTEFAFAIS